MNRRQRIEQWYAAAVLQLVVRVPSLFVSVEQRVDVQLVAVVQVAGVAATVRVAERQVPQYGADHVAAAAQFAHDTPKLCGRGASNRNSLRIRTGTTAERMLRVRKLSDAAHVVQFHRRGLDHFGAAGPKFPEQQSVLSGRCLVVVVQRQRSLTQQYGTVGRHPGRRRCRLIVSRIVDNNRTRVFSFEFIYTTKQNVQDIIIIKSQLFFFFFLNVFFVYVLFAST